MKEKRLMEKNGVVRNPSWTKGRCPYCWEKIGIIKRIEFKIKKKYLCKNCGGLIDEKHIVW